MHVGVEEARAEHGDLLIVDADHARHAADVAKRALLHAQKRLEALIPHGFFVAMPGVTQRHPKHPGPLPLAGGRVERRRAAQEVDLALLPGGADEDTDGPPRRRERPDVALDRLVAGAVPEVFNEILPDALGTEPGVELLADRVVAARGAEASGAGLSLGRICQPLAVVPRDRFSANPGLGFDPSVAPPKGEQREYVLFLRHCQETGHRYLG